MKNKKKLESESMPEFEKSMDNLSQERKDYIDNSMKGNHDEQRACPLCGWGYDSEDHKRFCLPKTFGNG